MPARHHINNQARFIVTTWQGEAHDKEFIEALKKYQDAIQNHPDYINYNELVDFSNLTGIQLTAEGIKKLGKIASTTDKDKTHRKLGIVVSSKHAFGLARMYVVYRGFSKKAQKELCIFTSENDALEWLED